MSGGARAVLLGAALLAASPALARKSLPPGEKVDLNRAGVVELMRLPGVGQRRAQAIVAQRTRQPFRKVEDVLVVKVHPEIFANERIPGVQESKEPPVTEAEIKVLIEQGTQVGARLSFARIGP